MNAAERIIAKFGGAANLSRMLEKGQTTISYWKKSGVIPAKWHPVLLRLAEANSVSLSPRDFLAGPAEEAPKSGELVAPQDTKTPNSPFAKWPGMIELGGDPIDVYVLDTGQRVLALRSAIRSMSGADSGNLGSYIGVSALTGC